jgi:hypothetical protein
MTRVHSLPGIAFVAQPSQPLAFITVRLVQLSNGYLQVEER